MRRAISPALIVPVLLGPVLLGLAVFLAWMHPGVLDPRRTAWLIDGEDRGLGAIGLAAFLQRGGASLLLHQSLLGAPEGMGLLFTDSIPLLGLLLQPFAAVLPRDWQVTGWWYLACLVLHALFSFALLRGRAAEPVAAWLGTALLLLSPVLLARYGHASLCAQWIVLWGLWLFVGGERRSFGWAGLLGVAALVHVYLLLIAAAFWGSAQLRDVVTRPGKLRTIGMAAATLAVPVLALAAGGAFAGRFLPTGSYGRFTAALDAWWNPANPGYLALLPSTPRGGEQAFEGFQYLGAGMLLLVLLAAVALARDAQARRALRPLLWLAPAFAALAIVAVGPAPVWQGASLWQATWPDAVVIALDPVRASGRLLWPVTYTLAFAAIVTVMRARRAPMLLAAALALQIVDLAPLLGAVRATSAAGAEDGELRRTRDPRWNMLVAHAGSVDFQPSDRFTDLGLMEEIAWRAVQACRPVRYIYAARTAEATRRRLRADLAEFRAGRLDPARLYILAPAPVPPALRRHVRVLDGVRIIPPDPLFSRTAPPAC